jgi:Phosphotransferase enzyme family
MVDKVPSPSYIMRVALPVDPYFKTASEVATLKFLSQHTSIPVPSVIAYDTSPENKLEFEWTLMTRLPGVPLKELWSSPQLLWGEKVNIMETISGYIQQMQTLQLDKMGNLYLNGQRHPPLHWDRTSTGNDRQDFVPLQSYPQFVIGPVVAISFSYGNRIKLPSDHGPFTASSEWISSLLNLQVAPTEDPKANLPSDEDDGSPYDSDDILELNNAIQAASDILSLVPQFFADMNERFMLCLDDLSVNNILIDPVTHLITGVVD